MCASAAEAETAGLFHNVQHAIVIKRILEVMGREQNPVPLKTGNSTANSFVYDNIPIIPITSRNITPHPYSSPEDSFQVYPT